MTVRDALRIAVFVTGMLLASATPRADVKGAVATHVVSEAAKIDVVREKVVHIDGIIDPESEFRFMQQLAVASQTPGDIVILIDSPGGVVDNGAHMIQGLLAFKPPGARAICVVTGQAMSMAFNFLSFCDVRLATEDAKLLFHPIAIGGMMPPEIRLTAKKLRDIAKDLDRTEEIYASRNAVCLRMTRPQYDLVSAQEVVWDAQPLVEKHYLDGIAEVSRL